MHNYDFTKFCNIKQKHLKFRQVRVDKKYLQEANASEKHFSISALKEADLQQDMTSSSTHLSTRGFIAVASSLENFFVILETTWDKCKTAPAFKLPLEVTKRKKL